MTQTELGHSCTLDAAELQTQGQKPRKKEKQKSHWPVAWFALRPIIWHFLALSLFLDRERENSFLRTRPSAHPIHHSFISRLTSLFRYNRESSVRNARSIGLAAGDIAKDPLLDWSRGVPIPEATDSLPDMLESRPERAE
jgi:hypothetical protein